MVIKSIKAREILDSRGNPTVEVDLVTDNGLFRAAVPSGASTGRYEAVELRDNDNPRYKKKGVLKAVNNVNSIIAPKLIGLDPTKQQEIDTLMINLDKTENKATLGANAILAVSLAVCRAGAAQKGVPLYKHIADLAGNKELILPVPAFNVINGGCHAGNNLAMQEFMILPTGATTFKEALQMGAEVYHTLKQVIKDKYGLDATNVGDEGGFAPNIKDSEEGLQLLQLAIKSAGYTGKVEMGMDVAASEFFDDDQKKYDLSFKDKENKGKNELTGEQLIKLYEQFITKFPVISIEDPFDQDDWQSYSALTNSIGKQIQIVGDDLLVTNVKRIDNAIQKKGL